LHTNAAECNHLTGYKIRSRKIHYRIRDIVAGSCPVQRNALDVILIGRLAWKLNRSRRYAVD